jgi:hypothetical protein
MTPRGAAGEKAASPCAALIEALKGDGLLAEAETLDTLLRHTAWTTGTEFLGEFGLAMRKVRASAGRRMSGKTRACYKEAARAVRKAWPLMRL